MSKLGLALWLLLAAALSGCGSLSAPGCPTGQDAAVRDQLFFGGSKKTGGDVTAAEWQAFLDQIVTPRFPQGLTVFAATGQWKDASGRILTEPSRVLDVVHPGAEAQRRALDEIAAEYKRRFDQEAVLRVSSRACIAF